ncbi:4-(cytidine 5'-diphospho)-2-C-methyl-D-erythritol kinase [Enterococcus dongliensis]|uniref:4-diphosphocytidyl-2-C-methyl-D-erythritol kinase n=1 Tax=Enterococcus dongliensis TaxID=2559925 RepID=A0AAP5KS18_9ENTE|nr:4-(cytidine 5'-diphospho)-2-C-methyl-D-erythritol kinase [Enterococcus dongliensis]MDT2597596.1 4-(cytidine 5'-diphospho)-2-C-methyl-D-erythritol kinase [Enterococcus dongliensis]MDT2603691.1 4-(cytidine 5'-diphospho)-2-C-methyl-D-erythritol kinase [Enterococcus dongliensis]MDT2612850.1 4-(cytidine 5'-diphospho)-2-C-methyl-D-erythritol kinase [Enterococcus dongliensis]MDT2634154.1 4-(cytidine 5'-diphospho)-2-C-methyl-D-erythritol kinase [Enterococcus dongliensis]MDT2637084.1 4-(cytidine 5'-
MEIMEKAPAKINLGLDILGKRPDGLHELAMVMASIDLADRLYLEEIPEDKIIIETNKAFLPTDKKNHVYEALELIKERFDIKKGLQVKIHKEIPVAAGLGGGSTDSAAALRAVNRLWNLGLSLEELARLGAEIGSDVPYCVYGQTSLVEGFGEKVTPIAPMPQCWVVVVKPRMSVSTRTIFAKIVMEELYHPDIAALVSAIEENDYQKMTANLGNSMEVVTIKKHPIIQQLKDRMLKYGADAAMMSGSGPTVYALCHKYSRAKHVFNALKGFCEEVYLVRTLK